PGLVAKSLHTTAEGKPVSREVAFSLGHETPLSFRWGGWYVTGGLAGPPEKVAHLGNTFTADPERPGQRDLSLAGDARALKAEIESARYLAPSSDMVALLVFEHQARMHNLLTQANYETRLALARQSAEETGPGAKGQSSRLPDESRVPIEQAGE